MLAYHDEEWGVPSHADRHLFELLTLEGAQAGLSWSTILNKRDGYRRAFAGFDPAVARWRGGRRAAAGGSGIVQPTPRSSRRSRTRPDPRAQEGSSGVVISGASSAADDHR
jgi:hypothetical protein